MFSFYKKFHITVDYYVCNITIATGGCFAGNHYNCSLSSISSIGMSTDSVVVSTCWDGLSPPLLAASSAPVEDESSERSYNRQLTLCISILILVPYPHFYSSTLIPNPL